jgi:N-acetylmuramoyl-L-alanine amidase
LAKIRTFRREIHIRPLSVLIAIAPPWLFAALLVWLAALATVPVSAQNPAEKLNTYTLFGAKYVSLHQWARIKGFALDWDKRNKIVHLRSNTTRLSFVVNSKRATINTVTVWLCSPLSVHHEALYVSERDVYKTLNPLLYPDKLPKGKQIRTIVIAPGHGGKDPGNMVNKFQEKTYTLLMAKALKDVLVASGFKVMLTRETDLFVDLEPQAAIARRAKADLFISVHYNAVADVEPRGVETFSLTPAGAISTNGGTPSSRSPGNKTDSWNLSLAHEVHKSILQRTDLEDRGLRRAGFMVLREIDMPGILIEGGFMSNPGDAKKIFSAEHRKVMARAIADGVLSFKRLVERK